MAERKQRDVQIVWQRVTLIERFSSVLYPLDLPELLRQIPTIGYVVSEPSARGIAEGVMPSASKGDVTLIINEGNKTLGVAARDPGTALQSYEELRCFYIEHLDPSPGLKSHYHELQAVGWAKSGQDPVRTCSRFWSNHAGLKGIGDVLGETITNFGIHLVPSDRDPNQSDWFHITVEPSVTSGSKRYRFNWIWREQDPQRVEKQTSTVEEVLKRTILKLEAM